MRGGSKSTGVVASPSNILPLYMVGFCTKYNVCIIGIAHIRLSNIKKIYCAAMGV